MNLKDPGELPKTRLLFVDDEPAVLHGIERTLRPLRQVWDCDYLTDPIAAVPRLQAEPFHVVVSDMRMPGMDGAALLAKAREVSPETVRVMLTGNADVQTALAAVNQGHVFQFLLKPCEGERLLTNLTAAAQQFHLKATERELVRTRLAHAEKMTMVGQLAAGINHDLNNILTALLMQTQLAVQSAGATAPAGATLRQIREAAIRAAELTSELNGFSRTETGAKYELLNLAPVIESCTRMLQPMLKKHIALELALPPNLPPVAVDAGKLKQVIMNLAINARDAMAEPGVIRITACEEVFPPDVAAGQPQRRPGAYVRLTVSDNGCGIDAATQQQLFRPFFTTKASGKGTGLGLFMVRNILHQHQGWVELESVVGQGTAFHLFLPRGGAATARVGA